MSVTAILRIYVEDPTKVGDMLPDIRAIKGVKKVDAVLGDCHAIAQVVTTNTDQLGKLIFEIRKVSPNIVKTDTSIAFFTAKAEKRTTNRGRHEN